MSSCIYNGVVTHTRLKPVKHHLKYKTFSIFLDLDEVVNLDKSSFSWPVSYHTLDILAQNVIECNFDRTQWLYDCAYTQWTLDEINKGIVHKRLLDGNRT